MPDRRKRFTGEFKSKPALEAIKGAKDTGGDRR